MAKPKYVYHGSQYLYDIVRPQQARGTNAQESQKAIYAAETVDEVIPFALPIRWYPDDPTGKGHSLVKMEKPLLNTAALIPTVWVTFISCEQTPLKSLMSGNGFPSWRLFLSK